MKHQEKNTAIRDFKIIWIGFLVFVVLDVSFGIAFALNTLFNLTPLVIAMGILVLLQSQKLFYLALKPKVKLKKKTKRRRK